MVEHLLGLLLDPSGGIDAWRDWRRERRTWQRVRTTKIVGVLRVVDGTQPGLGRRWTRGAARVPPGVLVFEPDRWWRSEVSVSVHSATLLPPGEVGRRVAPGLGPRPRRLLLATATATLEWVVPEAQVERAMTVTRPGVRRAPQYRRPPGD